jgi:omega-amidase
MTSLALLQLDIAYGNPEKNYVKAEDAIKEAAQNGAEVVVLPEMWTTGYDLKNLNKTADINGKKTKAFISNLAETYSLDIVAGSVAVKRAEGITNTSYVFDKKGDMVAEYSKAHRFRLMDEEKYLIPGESTGDFSLDHTKAAVLICYDLRFPEWIRKHVLNGADILFIPAEWPKARVDHWRTLLLSRAIENQCFVIACNRAGSDPKNEFGGHSMIIDPWGKIIAETENNKETILYGSIEIDDVDTIRKRIPVFEDRRTDLY